MNVDRPVRLRMTCPRPVVPNLFQPDAVAEVSFLLLALLVLGWDRDPIRGKGGQIRLPDSGSVVAGEATDSVLFPHVLRTC